ncbi:neuropeptide Y receptor type 5-like [Physella acuta]|uniref:neuropeptide Y receptor type 5-like n=1 Tax=Physella acuta TaxID=109671 RepID=UPI0027DD80F3|nr:neuropeptide Y receptor type 5-like [Physella acuta]
MANHQYIELIIQFMVTNNHSDFDFKVPFVKPSLRYVYPFLIFLHVVICLVGVVGNTAIVVVIAKRRLYQDQTYFLLANLAFSDLIKCLAVLPISLANFLIQNWLFGSFLCFFLPMLQCFPVHASMLTYLTIAIDRYRLIVHPFKSRLPAGLCVIAVWVGSVCVVLPYAIYIKYIDLGASLGDDFVGVGICFVFGERRIEEYLRAMFVTLYAMPLAVMALLYVRVSAEFKSRETSFISVHFTQNITSADPDQDRANRISPPWPAVENYKTTIIQAAPPASVDAPPAFFNNGTGVTVPPPRSEFPERAHSQRYQRSPTCSGDGSSTASSHHHHHHHRHIKSTHASRAAHVTEDELDIEKEKRAQNYLITMTTLFGICWCPLHILFLVTFFVHETNANTDHYDITYILFAWFGFLSTCTTPVLFASWRMSDATKDRLRGYFRFSNRPRTSNCSQNQRFQSRFVDERQHNHCEERMIMTCRNSEHYGCDSV